MTNSNDLPPLTELPPETFELDRWLLVATGELCDDAKVRIRAEVETHFAVAREEAIGDGLIDVAARALALTSLGDPGVARKRFESLYLTSKQLRLVKPLSAWKNPKTARVLTRFCMLVIVITAPSVLLAIRDGDVGSTLACSGGIMNLFALWLWMSTNRRLRYLALFAIMVLYPVGFGCVTLALFHDAAESHGYIGVPWPAAFAAALVGAFVAGHLWRHYLPLVLKLRHKHNREAAGL